VKPHPVFGRSGSDLTVTVPVSSAIKVPSHRDAPLTVRIPPGTPHGRTFLIRGKGVRRKDWTTGNLPVTVEVMVPKDLNSNARAVIEELRKAAADQDPRE
jgi:molecular chaperone DnaJ